MHTHAHDPSIANEQQLHTCGVTITFTKILRGAPASGIFRLLEKTLYLWCTASLIVTGIYIHGFKQSDYKYMAMMQGW